MLRSRRAERLSADQQPGRGLACVMVQFDETCTRVGLARTAKNPDTPTLEVNRTDLEPLDFTASESAIRRQYGTIESAFPGGVSRRDLGEMAQLRTRQCLPNVTDTGFQRRVILGETMPEFRFSENQAPELNFPIDGPGSHRNGQARRNIIVKVFVRDLFQPLVADDVGQVW